MVRSRSQIVVPARFLVGIVALAASSVALPHASAAVIAGWDFNGLTNGGPSPLSPSTTDAAVAVTGLTRAFGGSQANAGANTWGSNGLTTQNQAAAVGSNSFFSFSITSSTAGISLSDIAAYSVWLYDQNPADLTPSNFFGVWQYRTNSNVFADIGSSFQLGSVSGGAGNPQTSVSLAGLSDLQAMPSGTQADFRFVVWGAGYGSNYAGFNSFQSGNDLVINGTIPVPEPSSIVLLAGSVCAFALLRRRSLTA